MGLIVKVSFGRSSEFWPLWFFSKDELVRQKSQCRPFSWPCPCVQESRWFSLMVTACWSEQSTVLWDVTPSDCSLGKIHVCNNMLLQSWCLNLPDCLSMAMNAQQQEVTTRVEGAGGVVVYSLIPGLGWSLFQSTSFIALLIAIKPLVLLCVGPERPEWTQGINTSLSLRHQGTLGRKYFYFPIPNGRGWVLLHSTRTSYHHFRSSVFFYCMWMKNSLTMREGYKKGATQPAWPSRHKVENT